jgi:hypothetical protein
VGYTFGTHRYKKDGHWYLGASPSKKAVARIKEKVGDLLVPSNNGTSEEVRDRLNQILRGWSAHFSYGTRVAAYRAVENYAYESLFHFLRRRHQVHTRGTNASASRRCSASWGYCNSAESGWSLVHESAVRPVGKPDALIGHVRLCVQRMLACSVGGESHRGKSQKPRSVR